MGCLSLSAARSGGKNLVFHHYQELKWSRLVQIKQPEHHKPCGDQSDTAPSVYGVHLENWREHLKPDTRLAGL